MPVPRCSANWPKICRLMVAPGLPASMVTVVSWAKACGAMATSAIARPAVKVLLMSVPSSHLRRDARRPGPQGQFLRSAIALSKYADGADPTALSLRHAVDNLH